MGLVVPFGGGGGITDKIIGEVPIVLVGDSQQSTVVGSIGVGRTLINNNFYVNGVRISIDNSDYLEIGLKTNGVFSPRLVFCKSTAPQAFLQHYDLQAGAWNMMADLNMLDHDIWNTTIKHDE